RGNRFARCRQAGRHRRSRSIRARRVTLLRPHFAPGTRRGSRCGHRCLGRRAAPRFRRRSRHCRRSGDRRAGAPVAGASRVSAAGERQRVKASNESLSKPRMTATRATRSNSRATPLENVDAAELAKFAALAHQWWDPESPMFGPLHKMNPLRLDWIDRMAGGLVAKCVVDVVCGGGILPAAMAGLGAIALGIGLGEKPLGLSRMHKFEAGANVDYRRVSAEALAAETPATFDVVACMELLEHVPQPGAIVAACGKLAKAGGIVVVSTIN